MANEFENNDEDFEDLTEKPESETQNNNFQQTEKIRVKLPRGEEVIGIIENRLGGNKMMVTCVDGKTRTCRVPGRLRRQLWLRTGDVVIVEPWEFDKEKGDVIFKYRPNQVDWLRKNGHLEKEISEF